MSVKPMRIIGDPVLRTPADTVTTFDQKLRDLIEDMVDTMFQQEGVGLAGPQIGVGLRVFTYHVDDVVGHMINPELEIVGDDLLDEQEGCLSIPGLYYNTKRHSKVVATGVDMHGKPLTLKGSGNLMARMLQHETDHLNGTLYVDRLDAATRKEAMKAIRSADFAGAES